MNSNHSHFLLIFQFSIFRFFQGTSEGRTCKIEDAVTRNNFSCYFLAQKKGKLYVPFLYVTPPRVTELYISEVRVLEYGGPEVQNKILLLKTIYFDAKLSFVKNNLL